MIAGCVAAAALVVAFLALLMATRAHQLARTMWHFILRNEFRITRLEQDVEDLEHAKAPKE